MYALLKKGASWKAYSYVVANEVDFLTGFLNASVLKASGIGMIDQHLVSATIPISSPAPDGAPAGVAHEST